MTASPFFQDLSDRDRERPYSIIRPKPHCPLTVIFLSDMPIMARLHFYENRSWLCTMAEDCSHCERSPWTKLESYQFVTSNHTPKILALPRMATNDVNNIAKKVGSLRGLSFVFSRVAGSRSPIRVECVKDTVNNNGGKLPRTPDLEKTLISIFS